MALSHRMGARSCLAFCWAVLLMVLLGVGESLAVDFKVKGVWQLAFQHSNVTPMGVNGADNFGALQRFRTQLDAVASEHLSGSLQFEIGDIQWGQSSTGGALGADGQIVELRYAYLDWMIPETEIKVRMGLQLLKLPGVLSRWGFGAVFGHDMAGVSVSSPLVRSNDLDVDATFFWARPYNDNSSNYYTDGSTTHLDNLDVFALSVPFRTDRLKINPWVMYAMIGKYSLSGLSSTGEPAIVVPRGGLMPVMGGGSYVNGFQPFVKGLDRAWGDGIWAGMCGEFFITDNFRLAFEGAYGSVNMGEVKNYTGFGGNDTFQARRAGWYIGAKLDYKFDWGTPGILAWYGPGDDDNPYNGSERLPSFNTPFGVTSLGFGGGDMDSVTWKVLGHNPSGMLGAVAQIEDISFLEDLTHVIRFGYYWGTNSPEMPRKANMTWPSRVDGPQAYLTTTDSAWEVNLVNRYKIYENLQVSMELAYVRLNLDGDTWGEAANSQLKDNYRISCLFTYSF